MIIQEPFAVCALILVGDKILGVSRKDNFTQFGLPGGKIEEGELSNETLIREVFEETGLIIMNYKHFYENVDDHNNLTVTYICDVIGGIDENTKFNTKEKGVVKLCDWDLLLEGPFSKYNYEVKNHLEKRLANVS